MCASSYWHLCSTWMICAEAYPVVRILVRRFSGAHWSKELLAKVGHTSVVRSAPIFYGVWNKSSRNCSKLFLFSLSYHPKKRCVPLTFHKHRFQLAVRSYSSGSTSSVVVLASGTLWYVRIQEELKRTHLFFGSTIIQSFDPYISHLTLVMCLCLSYSCDILLKRQKIGNKYGNLPGSNPGTFRFALRFFRFCDLFFLIDIMRVRV